MLVYALIIWLPGFDDEFGLAKQHALEVALEAGLDRRAGQPAGLRRRAERELVDHVGRQTAQPGVKALPAVDLFHGSREAVDTIIFCTVAAQAIGIDSFAQWANYALFASCGRCWWSCR